MDLYVLSFSGNEKYKNISEKSSEIVWYWMCLPQMVEINQISLNVARLVNVVIVVCLWLLSLNVSPNALKSD